MYFDSVILTQHSGMLAPIAKVLGVIINALFNMLDKMGMPNIGLSIILFTIFIYLILMPLTFKQQKFAKMSAVMQPEIKAVQEKYKNKKDAESMQKQNEELQRVYKKYGVSPTGSCVQLLIQMPILFALYRVIYNMPAYITKVYDALSPLAEKIEATPGGVDVVKGLTTATKYFSSEKIDFSQVNTIIDVLNRASSQEWEQIRTALPQIADTLDAAHNAFLTYYRFGWINIADTPSNILSSGWSTKNFALIIGAILIPLLAALSQWLNVLFMPQANNNDPDNPMAASMKSMNVTMPLISAVFCFTLPAGMGIYWIASAVVRCIQQIGINKYFDRVGLDKIIADNVAKAEKKEEKAKKLAGNENTSEVKKNFKNIKNLPSPEKSNTSYKKGSLTEKANMVNRLKEKEQ